uniref:Cytochrome c oxidase subunit 2 n=1 Tax=Perumytilus purpuratus TaxID=390823 RepID=A0A346KL08_PERPP|nr:cytochrome c oxidase subunit II [Perumytilus purpuratus]
MAMYGSKVFPDWVSSSIGDNLNSFYHLMMMVAVYVVCLVSYFIFRINTASCSYRRFKHHELLEWAWTVVPMLVLAVLWVPSVRNLYMMNHIGNPYWSFKALGHQWYWTYEYLDSEGKSIEIESYMVSSEEGYRLLDVDNRMVAPSGVSIRVLVSSEDVLHSFALPSCNVKVDAIPGRMNQACLFSDKAGIAYGQCSELCGVNHSFMPIVLEFIPTKNFKSWWTPYRRYIFNRIWYR